MRAPVIAGLDGGEGTTTLAAALHGRDGGRHAGGAVDVLVCRPGSLARAAEVPGVPVLVVVADDAVAGSVQAHMREVGSRAVVLLPHVGRWREGEPLVEARALLGLSAGLRPRELGPYAVALLAITAAVVGSGALTRALPVTRPTTVDPSRATPLREPAPPRPATPLRVVVPAHVPAVVPVPVVRPDPGRAPVLVRAAAPPPRPVRLAAAVPVRPVAGTPLRLRSAGPVNPVPATPVPVAPGQVVAAIRPAAAVIRPVPAVPVAAVPVGPAQVVPITVLCPQVGSLSEPDDDALEAEPHLRDLRTG